MRSGEATVSTALRGSRYQLVPDVSRRHQLPEVRPLNEEFTVTEGGPHGWLPKLLWTRFGSKEPRKWR